MVNIHLSRIRAISILILSIPVFIFFLFWLRPVISIPATILLGVAIFLSLRSSEDKVISVKWTNLLILAIVILFWAFLSGQGRFFTQTPDHIIRNAIMRDMINYRWPVRYGGAGDESLVYYIGHWMVPGAVGKLFANGFGLGFGAGYLAARIALLLWSSLLIYLTVLLVLFKLNRSKTSEILLIIAIFVFFSGMDIVGNKGTKYHIENWAGFFSYSAMCTQLIDVFNQALPAWLAMALTVNEKNEKSYALIGLLLLSTSPLPMVGLATYMAYCAVKNLLSNRQREQIIARLKTIFSPVNIIAVLVLFPIYWIYYNNNIAIGSGVTVSATNHYHPDSSILLVPIYLGFILLEFGLLLLAIANKKNLSDAIFIGVTLSIIPFIHIGWSIDFCMRASIPILFLLMIMLMEYLMARESKREEFKYNLVLIVVLIGALTGPVQYASAIKAYVESHGESVKTYDIYTGLGEMPLEDKGNSVGVDSENTLYFKYLAR